MNRAQFDRICATYAGLSLRCLPSKVVHVFADDSLLCQPDGKCRKTFEVSREAGPDCAVCIFKLRALLAPKISPANAMDSLFAIFGHNCIYCNIDLTHPEISPTKDHLVAKSKGGANTPLNLVPACRTCNGAKADKDLAEFVAGDISKYRAISERIEAGFQRYKELVLCGLLGAGSTRPTAQPQHPGETLKLHYQKPLRFTTKQMAELCEVSVSTMSRVLGGQAPITPRLALRLEHILGTPAENWLQLQARYDLWALENVRSNQARPRKSASTEFDLAV